MKRREALKQALALGAVPALSGAALSAAWARVGRADPESHSDTKGMPPMPNPLKLPAQGSIPVAFVVSDGVVVIDLTGPWGVFQAVSLPGHTGSVFQLYTVAETTAPIRGSGGLKIVPDYTFGAAPTPKVIVIPQQGGRTQATLDWIRKSAASADLTMSICTGAFLLASTGLLSGRAATTHHDGYKSLAMEFPDIRVQRGARFVDDGSVATSGGLFAGIDLALHVVERYYGRAVAEKAAYQMEYQGQGWTNPNSNAIYAEVRTASDQHPLCPVCDMEVDPASAPKSTYKGKTYYFCMPAHKDVFDSAPEKWVPH